MSSLDSILPSSMPLDSATLESAFADVPGKWGVVLLCDQDEKPLQLICTRNMRAMLRRRFEPPADDAVPTKRIDYRSLVCSIRWCRVDSELEMDLVYIDAARACFPIHWRGLIPDRRAFFVHVDPARAFADFERSEEPDGAGIVFGPFVDRTKADRWIDQVRDAFDLCRYHNILVQTPHGKACTYKQMGKCPAPCDGTVPLSVYQQNLDRAVSVALDPKAGVESLRDEMNRLAKSLEFEAAGKVKGRIDLLTSLGGGAFRSVRPLGSFDYLSVQPGPRKGTAKLFRVRAGAAVEIAGIAGDVFELSDLRSILAVPIKTGDLPPGVLLGAVCHHLGSVKSAARFIGVESLDEKALRDAVRAAMKVQPVVEDAETIRETVMPG